MWCGLKPVIEEAAKSRDIVVLSDGVPQELEKSTKRVTKLIDSFLAYSDKMASPPSPVVGEIIEYTNKIQNSYNPQMMTGHEEGQVLRMLVSMCKAKHVLEIGMFTGCGALSMAEALPRDGTVVTCDIDPKLGEIVREMVDRSPHGKKIVIKIGPALETLNVLRREGYQFDFVFIDADNENKFNYYQCCLEGDILAPGGTICVDNVINGGAAYLPSEESWERCTAEFNDHVAKDDRVYQILLPVRDGMLIVRRKADVDIEKTIV